MKNHIKKAKNYSIELNNAPAADVTERVIKGKIAIIKHTDDGETPGTGYDRQGYRHDERR